MATVKQLIKYSLFKYPSLYSDPLDVLIGIFTSSSYQWTEKGELGPDDLEDVEMKFEPELEPELEPCLAQLHLGRTLQHQAEKLRRQWIVDNINDILEAKATCSYFRSDYRNNYHVKNISTYNAFDFPKNITEDWKKTLFDFFQWWLVQLNNIYGCDDGWEKHWPKHALEGRAKIMKSLAELNPNYFKNKRRMLEEVRAIFSQKKELEDGSCSVS